MLSNKPSFRGVGLNFRTEIEQDIVNNLDKFDVIEICTDFLFMDGLPQSLQTVLASKAVIFHGLKMSLGSDEELNSSYVEKTIEAVHRYRPLWFSDHLGFTCIENIDVDQFMPIRRSDTMLDRVTNKVDQIIARVGPSTPFLIENITYYFDLPRAQHSEPQFLSTIIKNTGCGLLLDLNNLHTNAVNHNYDPYEFLTHIPLDQVVEIHIAGGTEQEGILVDSHAHTVPEPVWELLAHVCENSKVNAVILERDRNFDFDEILAAIQRARGILLGS